MPSEFLLRIKFNRKYNTFIYVLTVYFSECRFGTAAISTINTNKKRISKLQNKETERADEGQ